MDITIFQFAVLFMSLKAPTWLSGPPLKIGRSKQKFVHFSLMKQIVIDHIHKSFSIRV